MAMAPLTQLEAEALAFARREIAHWHSNATPWSNDGALSEAAGCAFAREQMRAAARVSTFTRMQVIAMARFGDEDARAILRDLILETRARHEQLPLDLENYTLEVVHGAVGHEAPGPKRKNKILRNILIALTVAAVVDRFKLDPTGRSPHRRSACSIVAEALADVGHGIGQKAVEEIWRIYKTAMPTVPGWASALPS